MNFYFRIKCSINFQTCFVIFKIYSDPSTLPKVTGGTKAFQPTFAPPDSSDAESEEFREREFDDSFLKQQEAAESMAFLEEKRRQFMYQQGLPKQTVIPKDGEEEEEEEEETVDEDEKQSKESKEEEEEKSQEVSKEDKEEETEKSAEVSKEEEKEEESVEAEVESETNLSSESSAQSGPKLSKYKIKKKAIATKKRNGNNGFKSRMDDYDMIEDQLATVPWDDRIRNDSDPLKPKEIYDKLFGRVLPFQLPSLPKIARNIPGMSFLASNSEEVTTTTTRRPGIFKRMFKAVTGSGSGSSQPTPVKKRNGMPMPMRRYRRDAESNTKLYSNDAKIVKQIRDPARQCRMIYKGCDLPYDHIMKMVSTGQVLIENDGGEATTTKKPAPIDPTVAAQDDEADQAIRDKLAPKKSKPIPQMLAQQAHLGGKKKLAGPGGLPIFGKNKKPIYDGSDSEEYTDAFQKPKQRKHIASLPLLPMRYQWGKPTYTVHGKPTHSVGPPDFSGGYMNPTVYKPPPPTPTTTTTTTTERPIFAASPLDKKDNYSIPYQHSVIKLNKTHAVHVLKKKPYNPAKTRTRDEKGRPVSFSTVFSEIAGNTGGIHDFFDRISGAFGGDGFRETAREFPSAFPGPNTDANGNAQRPGFAAHAKPTAFPSAKVPDNVDKEDEDTDTNSAQRDDDEDSDEEEDDEENDDQEDEGEDENNDQGDENNDHGDENNDHGDENNDQEGEETEQEEGEENNDQEDDDDDGDEEDEEDTADDIGEGEQATPQQVKEQQQQQQKEPVIGQPLEPEPPVFEKKKPDNKNNQQQQQQPQQEEEEDEEEDEEEAGDDNAEETDIANLPENIPPFIKQSMIEDLKRKKQEAEQGGGDEEEEDDQQGGPPQSPQGGPGGMPGGPGGAGGGMPGGLGGAGGGGPSGPGAFGGRPGPSQGGQYGSQQGQGPPKSQGLGGLFSFLG